MGDSGGQGNHSDGERPLHEVSLAAFSIDVTTVTNDDWARFVADTGFVTDAERLGLSAVFHLYVHAPTHDILTTVDAAPWWRGVRGADWAHPEGRRSSLDGRDDHPVVHVSYHDALAYCAWAGRRLPTEAEWEYAARGGIAGAVYPWGNESVDAGGWRANIWQGTFPAINSAEDGFVTTAPVRSFAPNGYGLWQCVGNVWEWCADVFHPRSYASSPRHAPAGPQEGFGRVQRGGSYLCHESYCNRYRNSARSHNTADSATGNAGFRTVALA